MKENKNSLLYILGLLAVLVMAWPPLVFSQGTSIPQPGNAVKASTDTTPALTSAVPAVAEVNQGTKTATPSVDDELISVNFQNADINQVIQVLGDITDTVIIPPPDLTGTITISSMDRVRPEVVAPILESALMTKGYTVIRTDTALKIVPMTDTKQSNVAVKIGINPASITENDVVITQVMPLEYASALQLKTILQPLIGKHGNILSEDRTNTLIITDLASNIKRLATVIAEMERPLPSEMQVKTFVLNYADSEKVAEILKSLSSDDKNKPYPRKTQPLTDGKSVEIYGPIQAFAEKGTSSIVVTSAPVNFPSLEQIIKDLDTFPSQAMIEVVIMDVMLDDNFKMGVELSDATTPTLTTKGIMVDGNQDNFDESIFHSLLGLATDASTAGFTYRLMNSDQTQQLLAFILKSQANSKDVSPPQILASNNQESSITVAQEIPIIQSSTTDLANNVTNVDYRYENVGLNIKVTPRISRDDYVNMKIHAEFKDIAAQKIYNASVINNRTADATVLVPNGQTVVLGGLMRDNDSVIEKKVPLLGDIPFLGVLFKSTETSTQKTELLIFLTPHIVKNPQDLKDLSAKSEQKAELIKAAATEEELKNAVQFAVDYKKEKRNHIKPKKPPEAQTPTDKSVEKK